MLRIEHQRARSREVEFGADSFAGIGQRRVHFESERRHQLARTMGIMHNCTAVLG